MTKATSLPKPALKSGTTIRAARSQWSAVESGVKNTCLCTAATLMAGLIATSTALAASPWDGSYASRAGRVQIRPAEGGALRVVINASDPQGGQWTCEFAGQGRPGPEGTLLIEDRSGGAPARIRLSLNGDRLSVKDVSSPAPQRDYCGLNGSVDGVYRRR